VSNGGWATVGGCRVGQEEALLRRRRTHAAGVGMGEGPGVVSWMGVCGAGGSMQWSGTRALKWSGKGASVRWGGSVHAGHADPRLTLHQITVDIAMH